MSEHLYTYSDPPRESDLKKAVSVLENGGVLAYATDFNWAFGCDPRCKSAIERIKILKKEMGPVSLLCDSIAMASKYALLSSSDYRWLKKAWPGPFTVLMPASASFPKQIREKRRIVGLRVPKCSLVRSVISMFERPIASTTVPQIEGVSGSKGLAHPNIGYEVFEAFGHGIDLLLDLGEEVTGQQSTIIDLTSGVPELIRDGIGDKSLFDL